MMYHIEGIENEEYVKFIQYALDTSDYFMLVYSRKKQEGFKKSMKIIKKDLHKLKVKSQFRFYWAGTEVCPDNHWEYQVSFYRAEESALQSLLSVNSLFEWDWPSHPQDLSFYRSDQCWFYSVSHERMAIVVMHTPQEVEFLQQLTLIDAKEDYVDSDWIIEEEWLKT